MDLEDHSESIHKKIQDLQKRTQQIVQDQGFFGLELLPGWGGLAAWLKSLIKIFLLLVILIVLGCVIFGCVMSVVKRTLEKLITQTWVVQKENGGSVEDLIQYWLKEKNHSLGELIQLEDK